MSQEEKISSFKRALKHYRRQQDNLNQAEDLHELIDFQLATTDDRIVNIVPVLPRVSTEKGDDTSSVGHNASVSFYEGPMFGLRSHPGFVYCPDALSHDLQERLAYDSLTTFCEEPHSTNIDLVPPKPSEMSDASEMWDLYKNESNAGNNKKHYRCIRKLSWATMGYHYDWSKRSYPPVGGAQSTVPYSLARIGRLFAETAKVATNCSNTTSESSFEATACIVNYYTTKSVMGGHSDDLEDATEQPIVSLSVGRPAIFLLGGPSPDDDCVVAILVRPGDVMIMGGECRLNYHAMARLLPVAPSSPSRSDTNNNIPDDQGKHQQLLLSVTRVFDAGDCNALISIDDKKGIAKYLSDHRININIRQVYS